jgi:hypothetical protein
MNQNVNESEQLTLFAGASPANHSATPENGQGETTSVTSGRRCFELYGRHSPLSSLVKTLLESSAWTAGIYSKKYSLIWRVKGTSFNRLLFQLYLLERRTDEIEFGLLPTAKAQNANSPAEHGQGGRDLQTTLAMLPTPNARDWKGPSGYKEQHCLPKEIGRILGTPTSRDWEDVGNMENVPENGLVGRQIGKLTGTKLRLQPAMCEWMMGFPLNWTSLEQETTEQPG